MTKPTVLVTAGSKHGSTAEIAVRIGQTLERHRCRAVVIAPGEVETIEAFDAVVLGSAVYAGRWTQDAMAIARRIAATDPPPPVWIFSSGPVGNPPKPEEDPVDTAEVVELTKSRQHRVFPGKIDKTSLHFGEKAIVLALKVPEGDFRDWSAVEDWAAAIAEELLAQAVSPAN
ncbi:MAG TPA: flavodoxin domain-containing protein [Acidimicrobiia bacterium]|nr:flavodoxin domain-containing protein [Acidimicrobiia bacterium]